MKILRFISRRFLLKDFGGRALGGGELFEEGGLERKDSGLGGGRGEGIS